MEVNSFEVKVGWKKFQISKKVATSIPESLLAKIGLNQHKETVFERDPKMFRFILNAHTTGILHAPRDVCPCAFREEMEFWKIPHKMVAPCCWKTVHKIDKELETLKLLINEEDKLFSSKIANNKVDQGSQGGHNSRMLKPFVDKDKNKQMVYTDSVKTRLWLFLEEPGSSTSAKVWCFFYIFLVIVSIVLFVISSEKSVRVTPYLDKEELTWMINSTANIDGFPEKAKIIFLTDPHPALFAIDVLCMFVFMTEALVNFCVCPNKRNYFCNIHRITKVVLCITMLITLIVETNKHLLRNSSTGLINIELGKFYFACKSMNALRLILLFRLRKLYNGLHILLLTLEQSIKEFSLLAFSFGMTVIMFGCLIFSAEIESDMFPSTQISMWWALITMTTIGYGDFFPTTPYGYFIGSLCAISGVIVIALPVASIAGTFSDLYSRNSDLQRHKQAIEKEERQSK